MKFPTWFRGRAHRQQRFTPPRQSARLRLERLEDRTVPSGFAAGDVFVSAFKGLGQNFIRWFHPDGTLVQVLDPMVEQSDNGGMAFDSSGNLYSILRNLNTVLKFSKQGTLLGSFGSGYDNPTAITFDALGNALVGNENNIMKLSPSGKLLATFTPVGDQITGMELAQDQKTLFYVDAGDTVRRYDVVNRVQLPDFADGLPPEEAASSVRLLPDGGALVADYRLILRLDAVGHIIQTYQVPEPPPQSNNDPGIILLTLALDPDGHSFWSCDASALLASLNISESPDRHHVYKLDIDTGKLEADFDGDPTIDNLAVFGDHTAAQVPMAVIPPVDQKAVEGTSKAFSLGSFVDVTGGLGPWQAAVKWGDGTTDTLAVSAKGSLGTRSHTFAEEGNKTVTVTVTDLANQRLASGIFPVGVTDPKPVPKGGYVLTGVQGVLFINQTVATFTDPGGAEPNGSEDSGGQISSHYSALIDWGDGTPRTAGTISFNGTPGSKTDAFTVTGSHVYNTTKSTATITVFVLHETLDLRLAVKAVSSAKLLTLTPPVKQSGVEGTAQDFALGSFADATGAGPWNVDVHWGDGAPDTLFTASSIGSLGTQNHEYGEEGTKSATVTVKDTANGLSVTTTFQVNVSDPGVLPTGGFVLVSAQGVSLVNQMVATFIDPGGAEPKPSDPGGQVSDHYSAQINWGDNTPPSAGVISYSGTPGSKTGLFIVTGSHTYNNPKVSTPSIVVLIHHESILTEAISTAHLLTVTPPVTQSSVEGAFKSFQLGSFVDPTGTGFWRADVNWGDGSPDTAFLTGVTGSLGTQNHLYGEEGAKTVTLTVTDDANRIATKATFQVQVTDPAVLAKGGVTLKAGQGIPLVQTVAIFTDPGGAEPNASDDPGSPLGSHYSATIDWGDDSPPNHGLISFAGTPGSKTDVFRVSGSHTYTHTGTYTIKVVIDHEGIFSSVTDTVVVFVVM